MEDYPFGDEVAVVKVAGTMFALVALGPAPGSVSLKFDQDLAAGLRGRHAAFTAGYHLNRRHWSTVTLDGSAPLIIQAAQVQEELGGQLGGDGGESLTSS